jgi:hypothetical protein
MTCGGSHLGFRIGIKNPNVLEDLQMIIPMIIGRSSTKCGFFMPIGNPRWPPPQDIVLKQTLRGKDKNLFF